ncbi:MAG: translation initiation factor IF-3 [Actinobacteria bacterium]|nr:translation initiation factor IF-3 [Actinomycetota bacterium]
MNDRIRAREVRLVGPDGAQIGITPLPEALNMARELELDLVEVADKANPPVCRIMDYGKYKYEAAQRAKESRKKSTNIVVKEMKYRPKIGVGDFDTKTKKVEHFLAEGHKVKVTIMFRGREMQHPELGRKILDQVAAAVTEVAKVEIYPRLDGRNMTMVLGPDKKAQAAADKKRQTAETGTPEVAGVDEVVVESIPAEPIPAPAPEAAEPVAVDTESPEAAETPEA